MPVPEKRFGQWFLIAGLAVTLYFCFRIVQPFLVPIFLALVLSALLTPIYSLVARKLNGRRSLAALLVCIGLTVAILIPVIFLSISIADEATDTYQHLKDPETLRKIELWLDPIKSPLIRPIATRLPASLRLENFQLGAKLGAQAQRIGAAMLGVATTFAAGAFNFLMDYFIMIIVLFFLLRDSAYFAEQARTISPLSDDQERMLVERFRSVARATVFGNLATSLTQGLLSAVIFALLRLPNPILWGGLTALFSLVPVVGTALIWVPWTIYLLSTGAVAKGIVFLVLQVVAVGGIDNILRPMFIRGGVKMHTLIVFFSILGGISYFGLLGMFFGPLVFAIAVTLLEFSLPALTTATKSSKDT
jgi:predicted PurR-regulated permease PerM